MSTQTRSGGGGGGGHTRNQKKSNASNSGGGGAGHLDGVSHAAAAGKKGGQDASKTDKPEKAQPKATTEQLRIAQITNSTTEDPQINEKVLLLLTMTQRSEEEVCCALNECDYDLEAAANFLIEELPQGAFAKYEKKRKNKAASNTGDGAAGDGDWADGNANADKREKSRNRSSNRGGTRGSSDSRGWRGRETRENERNQRESREPWSGQNVGQDRGDDRANDNYRGQRNGGGRSGPGGGGRGGGFVSRSGRGGGRMGGRTGGPRGDRGSGGPGGAYGSGRGGNANEDHHEVELWDNTIAQNAEKQQQAHDDAWGDWNNEEYEGSLKDSKVFTTSNLATQSAANVVSGTGACVTGVVAVAGSEISAPPGLEHQLVQQGSHLEESSSSGPAAVTPPATLTGSATTPLLQYSAAVSNPPPQLQTQATQSGAGTGASAAAGGGAGSTPSSFVSASPDTFSSAASAAATLVHQAQKQQQLQQQTTPIKPSATLSVEQSQYFNSLASQGVSPGSVPVQSAPAGYAQNSAAAYSQTSTSVGVSQYPNTYANVFASGTGAGSGTGEQSQQQPQIRRARVKLPPPSKIPASAVEMPGDNALNNIGYLDVQFGALDFGTDDGFESLPEKVGSGFSIDGQQQQQQAEDYQSKSQQQQQVTLAAGLQSSQISDALSAAGYTSRSTAQQQGVSSAVNATIDQLAKSDPYGQTGGSGNAYQNAYQSSGASKASSGFPTTAPGGYSSSTYANVQSSVANSYQQQGYGSYQPSSYQQQAGTGAQSGTGAVSGGGGTATQNIPVGGSSRQNSTSGNASSAFLTSGYSTPQSAYQSSQSVYGNTGLSNSSGFSGSASNASSQYANFSSSAKLKDATTASSAAHYDSVSTSSGVSSNSGSTGNGGGVSGQAGANQAVVSNNNNVTGSSSVSNVTAGVASGNVAGVGGGVSQSGVSSGVGVTGGSASSVGVNVNNNSSSASSVGTSAVAQTATGTTAAVLASLTNKNSSSSNSSGSGGSSATTTGNASGQGAGASTGGVGGASGAGGAGSGGGSGSGLVPTNIQMVSQYIQTGLPYYQQPVYSYEELQMMQQRVPHVQGYYDLNYPPASLGAGRDNLGSVTYSAMNDGRFARTDNNSSPVGNVSSTMSQQAGSSAPMLNVPYAYFYGGNVMPGSFQYGTPAIYPQQIPAANTASGQQFPKPSYSAGYGSTSYDTLSQTTQDYSKGGYSSSVNQQSKTQTVSNQSQAGTGSDLTSSMYGKGHVALNKVNSYEKQSFHSGTPPPFNMPNTQTAGGTSAQPYGMYLPMPAAGHHNMIHQPIHQMDGRIHSSSRRDSNSAGQRQQSTSQSKSAGKQGYSPSYWAGQN
ncbi:protein lingerer isoform X2 [Drosophila teissieri]|uniref:protein lingerer isoform X2 n=1 Tax=Drosophila teissieri TaxID=7243 RepID=UPI001CBA56A0|nr:protein lingerer isoform X2 [Drosophila teissieri]